MNIALRQFDRVLATYQPVRRADLRPEGVPFIGQRCIWQAAWIIDEGEYAGQPAMAPVVEDFPGFAWAPLCDLQDLQLIEPTAAPTGFTAWVP